MRAGRYGRSSVHADGSWRSSMRSIRTAVTALGVALTGVTWAAGEDPTLPGNPRCNFGASDVVELVVRYSDLNIPKNHSNRHIIWSLTAGGQAQQTPHKLLEPHESQMIGVGNFIDGEPCDVLWQSKDPANPPVTVAVISDFRQAEDADFIGGMARPDASWDVVGVRDLTKDGLADVLWGNTKTGALQLWVRTSQGSMQTFPITGPGLSTNGLPVAVARLDVGTRPGIIWSLPAQNGGQGASFLYTPTQWSGSALTVQTGGPIFGLVPTTRTIVAVANIDADTQEDLLVWNIAQGQLEVAFMYGRQLIGSPLVTNPPTLPSGSPEPETWTIV